MRAKKDHEDFPIINSKEKSEEIASEDLETFQRHFNPGVTDIPYFPPRPATKKDVEEIVDRKLKNLSSNNPTELVYTKDKGLVRNIGDEKMEYRFMKTQKIMKVFEALIDTDSEDKFETTEVLMRIGKYAKDTTLRKAVGDFNDGVGTRLKLKYKLIEGRRGFGYRVNPKATVVKV